MVVIEYSNMPVGQMMVIEYSNMSVYQQSGATVGEQQP